MEQWGDPRPNYKWPVAVKQPIAAPAEKVWEAISMPGNLEHCHPFCAKNSGMRSTTSASGSMNAGSVDGWRKSAMILRSVGTAGDRHSCRGE